MKKLFIVLVLSFCCCGMSECNEKVPKDYNERFWCHWLQAIHRPRFGATEETEEVTKYACFCAAHWSTQQGLTWVPDQYCGKE